MSFDEGFRKLHEGRQLVAEGHDKISEGLEEVLAGRHNLEAELADLRESGDELKKLIMEQGAELRALRDRLNGAK